jgi:hypothetical protein
VYELHRSRQLNATDARDHVFALLGHFSARTGPQGKPIMEADYTRSRDDIYEEIAWRTLKDASSLFTLNAVQHDLNKPGRASRESIVVRILTSDQ